MTTDDPKLTPTEIAKRIRDKVVDLNDDLLLAKLAEIDIEFVIATHDNDPTQAPRLLVWCRQEV